MPLADSPATRAGTVAGAGVAVAVPVEPAAGPAAVALPGEEGADAPPGPLSAGRTRAFACVVSKVTVREKSCRWAPDASAVSSRLAALSRRVSARAEARACSENGGTAGSGDSLGISTKPRLNTRNAVKVSRA